MSSSYGAKEAESQEHNDKAKYDKQTLSLSFRIVISHKTTPFLSSVDHKQGETQPQHEEAKPDEDIDPGSRVLIRMKATYSKI